MENKKFCKFNLDPTTGEGEVADRMEHKTESLPQNCRTY